MRTALVTLSFLVFASIGVAQTTAQAAASASSLPKEPMDIFAAAAPLYNFSAPKLKPWRMKASYQLYDDQGKPTAQGSYEYWWASPDTYRSTWSRPGLEQTDWHVAGQHYHAGTGEPLEFVERKLQSDFLTPLPKPEDLDSEKVRFDKQMESFGSAKLPCVMVIRKMPSQGQRQFLPKGMFPTFCFDPEQPMLRAYYAFGTTSVIYNKVVLMQGLYLPRELGILNGKRQVLTAAVDSITGLSSTAVELIPSKDAMPVNDARKIEISSGVATGHLRLDKEVRPVYPQDAKFARISGKVVLRAVIGTDGHVHDLSAIEGPSSSLIESAMWAVSQWEYNPYLLNGSPVEVETTINVIFNLGN